MERSTRVRSALLFLLLTQLFISSRAAAQPTSDTPIRELSGVVVDVSGGVITRPVVIIRESSSALERIIEGAADGTFVIARLDPGRYVLSVSAPGFATAVAETSVPGTGPVRIVLSPAPIVEQVTVVSASRQEEIRDALNTRVDVVTRARIEESGGHETVGELLRELPGVITRRGSQTAGPAGQQIQGIDSRQVLVLLDGQPLAGARGIKRGGHLDLDRQSSARLERIEVVKGAASALYGSDAIGGVINLITREPSAPFDASVSLAGGSLGAVDARADGGFRQSRTFGVFSIERHQHDGFDLTPGTFDTTGAPFRRHDALGKLQHQIGSSLTVRGLVTGYRNSTTGRSNGELGPQDDHVQDRAVNGNAAASWTAGRTSLEARAYVSSYRENSSGRLAPPRSTALEPGSLAERFAKIDFTAAHTIGSKQMLQAGVEWARDYYEGVNRVRDAQEGHESDTAVLWAQHRWSVAKRLTTTVGLRVDRRSRFETAISPKIGANMRLTDGLSLRAAYGRGFRAPDLGQLYYRFLSPSNFYQVIGNPGLEPEFGDSLQLGGEYATRGRRARLGVKGFRNDVRDLIESVSLGFVATPAQLAAVLEREGLDPSFRPALGRLLFTYRNVANVVTKGVEVESEAALTRALSLGGAYTYLSAEDTVRDIALTGRHRHHGHLRVVWQPPADGLRASLRGTFFSSWIAARAAGADGAIHDTVAPRFALWDAYLSQRIVRELAAFLAVDNLADSQDPNTGVVLPDGTPAPIYRPDAGRTVRVGVTWSFRH